MLDKSVRSTLAGILESAPSLRLAPDSRLVVFSDLHLGNRGDRDDFLPNAGLFLDVLERHYLARGFTLVLNGDIEELKKFSLRSIARGWGEVYRLFGRFAEAGKLHKIVGNHDQELLQGEPIQRYPFPCSEALRLDFGGHSILVFHGHQVLTLYRNYNHVSGWVNKYVLYPLRIMNHSVAHDSGKKYKVEKKVYDFSSGNKIVSIIGHTHRPLFESLSKIDSVRFKIESLCREFPTAREEDKAGIETRVKQLMREMGSLYKNGKDGNRSSLYNSKILVPCLFNSGCAIGKRGITSIEITGRDIALVHWFDSEKSRKYLAGNGSRSEQLAGSGYYRKVLKKECLDYIFARITLLT